MGLIAILLSLGLLIFLAYRGMSVILLAPILALLAAGLSAMPMLASYTQVFMVSTGGFVAVYFPLFLLGAIFGKLMELSGGAETIGGWAVRTLGERHAILAIVLSCAILTYGGVSLFVVAFAIYPVAAALFAKVDIPSRLIPATVALGSFTFTMTALPGTPSIQNAIPMPYFGTTPFAAPGLGLVAAAVMFAMGFLWLQYRVVTAAERKEGYGDEPPAPALAPEAGGARTSGPATSGTVAVVRALSPIVLVLALNFVLSRWVFPAADLSYLEDPVWGGVEPIDVIGIWSIAVSLTAACGLLLLLNIGLWPMLSKGLSEGANASVAPVFNTASLVGFGSVIAILPAFGMLRDALLAMSPGNPLISLSVAVNVLAGITGSASGGMSIALESLGDRYLQLALADGIDPQVLHRVTAIATGGLDTLPHNGAVVTLLAICRSTHARSYFDIFMAAMLGPLVALATVILVASW